MQNLSEMQVSSCNMIYPSFSTFSWSNFFKSVFLKPNIFTFFEISNPFAMAKAIGEAGATVVIAGRNETKNKKSIEELNSLDIKCKSFIVDVVNENSCNKLIEDVALSLIHISEPTRLLSIWYSR